MVFASVSWVVTLRYLGVGSFATVEYLFGRREAEPFFYQSLAFFLTGLSVCYAAVRLRKSVLTAFTVLGVLFLLGETRFGFRVASLAGVGLVVTALVALSALSSRRTAAESPVRPGEETGRFRPETDASDTQIGYVAGYLACGVVCSAGLVCLSVGDLSTLTTGPPSPAVSHLIGGENVYTETRGEFRAVIALGVFGTFLADATRRSAVRWLTAAVIVVDLSAVGLLWSPSPRTLTTAVVGALLTVAAVSFALGEGPDD